MTAPAAMTLMIALRRLAALDVHYLPCGPCLFCGDPDKRHRLWDSIMAAPESDEETASNYGVTVEHVRAVRFVRPYRDAR